MALYHIETLITPDRVSLISTADFSTDLYAIAAARRLLRRGEAVEVWRGETLVYRTTLNPTEPARPQALKKLKRHQWPSFFKIDAMWKWPHNQPPSNVARAR